MKLIGALALVLASAGMGLAEALRLRRRARLTADHCKTFVPPVKHIALFKLT